MHNWTKRIFGLMCVVIFAASTSNAGTDVTHTIKVGETVRLEISSSGRSILNRSTGKIGQWSVNSIYLEVVSSSWDYAIVKGKKETSLAVVQLTVTHNHDGIYGDKYYDAFHVKVVSDGGSSGNGPTSLSVSPTTLTLNVGETYTVRATQTGAIGGCYFTSEDKSIASVTSGTMEGTMSYTTIATVTAEKAGSTYIYAKTMNGLSASCRVIVLPKQVASISIVSNKSLTVGETYTLTPTIYPYDAETTYTWTSDNSNVASVTSGGKVTAKSPGTARIKVTTDNGKSATCVVTVTPKPLENISLPSALTIEEGQQFILTPIIMPVDAQAVYTWLSSNIEVAEVSSAGLVKTIAPGQVTITVETDNGKMASCEITVLEDPAMIGGNIWHDNSYVEIYSSYGYIVYRGVASNCPILPKGVYIIIQGEKIRKISV